MAKYRRPADNVIEEPRFFLKHWWHLFVEWTKAHRDQLMTGGLAVLVALAALVVWQRYRESRSIDAWSRVSLTRNIPDLEAAVLRYAGTRAGAFLRLRLGDEYLSAGQPDEAARQYERLLESSEELVAHRAKFSLARAAEDSGDFDRARELYSQLAAGEGFWADRAGAQMEGIETRRGTYERLAELEKEMQEKLPAEESGTAQAPEAAGAASAERGAAAEPEEIRTPPAAEEGRPEDAGAAPGPEDPPPAAEGTGAAPGPEDAAAAEGTGDPGNGGSQTEPERTQGNP